MFVMKVEELRFSHCRHLLLFHAYFGVHAQPTSDLGEETQYFKLGPKLSRPIAVVIVVLFFIFFVMVFFSVYLRHYVELRAASDPVRPAAVDVDRIGNCHGLDPAVIRTIPVVVHSAIKDLKIGKWSLECAVCLSEFQDYETLRLLPKCGHVFHPNCIDAWLASCATCPICRAKLASDCPDKPAANSRRISTGGESSASELGEGRSADRHHVVTIDVHEADGNGDDSEVAEIREQFDHVETSNGITGKFPGSNSTGYSLVRSEEETEKNPLTSPDGGGEEADN